MKTLDLYSDIYIKNYILHEVDLYIQNGVIIKDTENYTDGRIYVEGDVEKYYKKKKLPLCIFDKGKIELHLLKKSKVLERVMRDKKLLKSNDPMSDLFRDLINMGFGISDAVYGNIVNALYNPDTDKWEYKTKDKKKYTMKSLDLYSIRETVRLGSYR